MTSTAAPAVFAMRVLVGVWIAGAIIWYSLAGARLLRFRNVLRYAQPASAEIQAEVSTIASRYGLHKIPRVLVADANVPPLIWSFGRRTSMVLPAGLLSKLGTEERTGLLAHELAHLKRGDHWVRWFELMVLGVYWWNPIVWWARAQIQQAEEECCDGWVVWAFPDNARLYAQTLLDTVVFLAAAPDVKPDMATAFNQGNSLKRRIEMIVGAKTISRRLSWKMRTVLVLFALAVTPWSLIGSRVGGGNESVAAEDTGPSDVASRLDEGAAPTAPAETTEKSQKGADVKLIRGTVVDQQGRPIAGVRLWHLYAFVKFSRNHPVVDARSDAEGRFTLEVPPFPSEMKGVVGAFAGVWAYSPKYSLGGGSRGNIQATNDPADIRLELAPATDTTLVVLDPEGQPLEGALVEPIHYHLSNYADVIPFAARRLVEARTDAEGRVRLPAMARDRLFKVRVTTKAYGVQTQQFTVMGDEPAARTIQIRPVCRIEGRVIAEKLEWARGKRLFFTTDHASVRTLPFPTEGRADVTTDREGRFVVPIIAAGQLQSLYMDLDDEFPVRPELPRYIDLSAGETTVIEFPMIQLVDIRGSIIAADTGKPLPGVKLLVSYGKNRAQRGADVLSDANGQFSARVLPGRVQFSPVILDKTKYLQLGSPPWRNVPDDADGFELPAIKVVPSKPLDGRLIDQDDAPVADVRVIAYYAKRLCSVATTDKDGRFRLPKMPVSFTQDKATYRVTLGIAQTRFWHDGGVAIVQALPFVLRVKR